MRAITSHIRPPYTQMYIIRTYHTNRWTDAAASTGSSSQMVHQWNAPQIPFLTTPRHFSNRHYELSSLYCFHQKRWESSSSLLGNLHEYSIPEVPTIGIVKPKEILKNISSFPQDRIRNISIIAHIDHGKTTLSDAILRRCGVLEIDGEVGTYMDKLEVERERGITIKAQTCSFFVKGPVKDGGDDYLINLIDTPGHVDFQYEVSRSLGACEGAVVLVDATQGIEAQTMANFTLALDGNLDIIPALTKLDAVLNDKQITDSFTQIEDTMGLLRKEVILTASKAKLGVEDLLSAVITRVRSPVGDPNKPCRGLLFDCWTNTDTSVGGIVCLIRVIDGNFTAKMGISLLHSMKRLEIVEVGLMGAVPIPTTALSAGMVGYVVIPKASRQDIKIGDTFAKDSTLEPIPGFKIVKPMVFGGIFPDEGELIMNLREAVDKLRINDPSVTCEDIKCPALGHGLQLGFLGMLHMQVFQERLFHEYMKRVLVTPAQIQYMYVDSKNVQHPLTVYNWRHKHEGVEKYLEPFVVATVMCNAEHFSEINTMAISYYRAENLDIKSVDGLRMMAQYRMPLSDLANGFFTHLKNVTHGYGSLEYDDPVYEEADLVKVDIQVNKAQISALSVITSRSRAQETANRIVRSLKENLTRAIIDLPIQAFLGGKCICRETVGAYKKDVTSKIHAGDYSRKQKKFDQQKKGKKALAQRLIGQTSIDQETLVAAMGATFIGSNQ